MELVCSLFEQQVCRLLWAHWEALVHICVHRRVVCQGHLSDNLWLASQRYKVTWSLYMFWLSVWTDPEIGSYLKAPQQPLQHSFLPWGGELWDWAPVAPSSPGIVQESVYPQVVWFIQCCTDLSLGLFMTPHSSSLESSKSCLWLHNSLLLPPFPLISSWCTRRPEKG